MRARATFSDFKFDFLSTINPCLPLGVTLELIEDDTPASEAVMRVTIPGVLFLPFEAGTDGLAGRLKEPKHYRFKGFKPLPEPKIGPDSFRITLENMLRANKEVVIWARKLATAVHTHKDNDKALKALRAFEEAGDPLFVKVKKNAKEESED